MMHLTNEAVQVKSKSILFDLTPGKNSFGKFEQGNKVYYNELEEYFKEETSFVSKNMSFKNHILPEIKVERCD